MKVVQKKYGLENNPRTKSFFGTPTTTKPSKRIHQSFLASNLPFSNLNLNILNKLDQKVRRSELTNPAKNPTHPGEEIISEEDLNESDNFPKNKKSILSLEKKFRASFACMQQTSMYKNPENFFFGESCSFKNNSSVIYDKNNSEIMKVSALYSRFSENDLIIKQETKHQSELMFKVQEQEKVKAVLMNSNKDVSVEFKEITLICESIFRQTKEKQISKLSNSLSILAKEMQKGVQMDLEIENLRKETQNIAKKNFDLKTKLESLKKN